MNWIRFAANCCLLRKEPVSLVYFVTNRCNARCRHCFIDFTDPGQFREELTVDELDRITRTLGGSLYNLNLTGGEPFLREDLWEIAECFLRNTPVRSIVVTTNGFFTDRVRRFLDRFIGSGHRAHLKISVSIDDDEKAHDRGRGVEGLHRQAMETLMAAQSRADGRVLADAVITVSPWNHERVVARYHRLRSSGVRQCNAVLARRQGISRGNAGDPAVIASYRALSDAIRADALYREVPGLGARAVEAIKDAKNRTVAEILSRDLPHGGDVVPCMAGSLFGVIGHDGDVFPCEVLGAKRRFGNLRECGFDFRKLWEGVQANDCRRFIDATRCACSYECAWSVNVLSSPRLMLRALSNSLGACR
jgi:MoaA/NifB/PqqE/SkfB family radical SAM enzyme